MASLLSCAADKDVKRVVSELFGPTLRAMGAVTEGHTDLLVPIVRGPLDRHVR